MSTTVLAFLFMLAGQTPVTQVFQHSQCSYSFEYPKDWQIVKNPDYITGYCATTLRPADYEKRMTEDDVDVYTLTVQVSIGTIEGQGLENGFEFIDGKWVVRGRQGSTDEAEVYNANGWSVLRGAATVGCHHKRGGFAGLCDEYRVVAKPEGKDQVVVIVGGAQTEMALQVILNTFKFLTR